MSNLSEEEAIKILNEAIKPYKDGYIISSDKDYKAIKTILNLIEKQQQEIDFLNIIVESDNDNYINKDKIREKIKELEKECEKELLTTWLESKIDVLQELLKEGE